MGRLQGKFVITNEACELLALSGLVVDEAMGARFLEYTNLIREWNERVSLVSKGDLEKLRENHVIDSLSLALHVMEACGESGLLLDIGGGAGFPAIPLKILLPELPVCMVERSQKKSNFLRLVVNELALDDVEIRFGEFPHEADNIHPAAITARAVERAEKVRKAVYRYMPSGCTFLCQSSDPSGEVSRSFHVKAVVDEWKVRGLRRGNLWLVRR